MTFNSEPTAAPGKTSDRKGRLILLAMAGLLVGLLGGWLTIQLASGKLSFGPYEYRGIVMPDPTPVSDFSLTAHDDETVRLSDFGDQIVLLYFGYTYCPDVCPTTLSSLAQALDELKQEEKEQIQVMMISVDPERDTPEALAEYVTHFDPSFLGLTGTEQELAAAAESCGVFYQKGPGSVESGYLVDHTATVSVLGKDGRLRLLYPFGTAPEDIAADLRHLLKDE